MLSLLYTAMLVMFIANLLMILCLLISKKSNYEREKNSPFECGFDPKSSARMPFSLRFFLITIIFLIFDVEIALLLPAIMNIELVLAKEWLMLTLMFIMILFVGLIHEWKQGTLKWTNFN